MSKYPRIGQKRKQNPRTQPGHGKPCICCQTPTTGKVDIEVNEFRGDDDVVPVCNQCQKGKSQNILEAYQA